MPDHAQLFFTIIIGTPVIQRLQTWFSIGVGQVRKHDEPLMPSFPLRTFSPFKFSHAAQLLALCRRNGLSVAALMMKNERCRRSPQTLPNYLAQIWDVMQQAVYRGLHTEGGYPSISGAAARLRVT